MVWCMDSLNVLCMAYKRFKTQLHVFLTQERLRDHDSMSRALMKLHWLPVDKRIEYKLLLYIRIKHCMAWQQGIYVNWLFRMNQAEF